MSDMEQDIVIARVRAALRGGPEVVVDQRRVAQLLAEVAETPRPTWVRRMLGSWRMPVLSGLGASAVALSALVVGFVMRGGMQAKGTPDPMVATGAPTGEFLVQPVTSDAAGVRVPMQFVFEHPEASSVSLVGDFNDWRVGAMPLTRLPNGLWTITVPLAPGRHVYQFSIDGRFLVADPRAPIVGDADYGIEGSVVMVFAR